METSLHHVLIAVRKELFPLPWRPWVFYLVNDRDVPIEDARLEEVGYEWGDYASSVRGAARGLGRLGPRSARAIWREDGDGAEVNPWIVLDVSTGGERHRLMYEFPKLYTCRRRERIPIVGGRGVVCNGEPCHLG